MLQHGGPDDEGLYCDEMNHVALGNRRLAFQDLSASGHMPMSFGNDRYWITYNGELYNFPEIKDELKKAGYTFRSNSDTEVILASFDAWGTNSFKRFNGMFAFALWDKKEETIYLVRDACGIKPLYYALTDEGLSFASEIRALGLIDHLQEENPDWPVYLLAYGHLPEPVTTLKKVKPLPKGCFLRYHINSRKWDIETFSFFNYEEAIGGREEVKEGIRKILETAVKRHLISDAPIGVFLSGGLDSGIIATLAAKHHKHELKTLSLDFEEEKFSEKKYQDLLIEKLQCPNWQEILTEGEFHKFLPDIINDMDLPGCDGLNTWFISKCARESGLKAVLSGVGGDELFGGYPSFRRINKVEWMQGAHKKLLRAGRYSGSKKLKRLAYLSLGGAKGIYLLMRGQFIPSSIAKQLDASEKEVWQILDEQPDLHPIHELSKGNQASWVEMNMYMQNQLLRDSDVMSMAHGVEIRVPFLDKELVSLAIKIKSSVKYSGALPKQLLIDCFKPQLPEQIWNRPKMGFSFPFAQWLSKSDFARELVSEENFKKFQEGKMHWSQFMSLMLLVSRKGAKVRSDAKGLRNFAQLSDLA